MNHDLKSLSAKLKASKTCFNVKKTELIHFCSRTEKLYYTLKFKLNWKRLRPNHAVKYLGVLKEKHLQWIKRKTQIQIKLNCALGIGNKMRNYTNRDVLKWFTIFSLVPILNILPISGKKLIHKSKANSVTPK